MSEATSCNLFLMPVSAAGRVKLPPWYLEQKVKTLEENSPQPKKPGMTFDPLLSHSCRIDTFNACFQASQFLGFYKIPNTFELSSIGVFSIGSSVGKVSSYFPKSVGRLRHHIPSHRPGLWLPLLSILTPVQIKLGRETSPLCLHLLLR